MTTVPEPLLRTIVEVYGPRRVVLFGSRARGDAGPDSDIDLVVVLDDDAPPAPSPTPSCAKAWWCMSDTDGAIAALDPTGA